MLHWDSISLYITASKCVCCVIENEVHLTYETDVWFHYCKTYVLLPGPPVSFEEKKVFKKAHLKKKVKKCFSVSWLSIDMPTDSKVLLVIRVSGMDESFSQEFVFLSIFFTQIFCVRHGGMMQWAAPQCAPVWHVWRVRQGFPFHRWGPGGPPPGIFFTNISSEMGILGQL